MKYYLICGERSGDLHSSNLIKEIKSLDPEASFRGMGGDYSSNAGLELVAHYQDVSVMGFLEVLLGFRKIYRYLSQIKKDLLKFRPDALILVDFGGFNMKIAAFAKSHKIKVHYYIPPKVWAWNQKRALNIKKYTDKVYSILPFEPEFYHKFGVKSEYVGNPLLDEIANFEPHAFFHQKNELNYQPIIALLPGSRKQELDNMLQVMLSLVNKFPNAQFVIAGVSNVKPDAYRPAIEAGIRIVFDQTYDLLHHATAAIVTSGTATLETALFRVPQVVVYKTSWLSYIIAKRLIRVPYIGLVNLIADREVVRELIQTDFNSDTVAGELNKLLSDIHKKAEVLQGYNLVKERLGENSASKVVASLIFDSSN
ncbi:Lipid-A-disaccharide synthase [Indibacter alkaliphilus LW1]|jgi:lipid-A-disaccharide synthase|uniref:Lipid-A-disaccharide synthase n=1 Tax=Indibacter alkaliphilus (strain CCUG 57479 / KCTC 22604 / LW1) TaxID=1189612 RepID=S2EBB3_INDAL|nr:lipid-A-disaccharide synthase [Indibacter alkaliphilus]EOZ99628.1 Lipid-A-disaccharide synthase [Indibacter alkaliphilus LW1]